MKDICMFFDGTGSKVGKSSRSNVLKMYTMTKNQNQVIKYYQPGIGEQIDPFEPFYADLIQKFNYDLKYLWDMATGSSLGTHVLAGYLFLMHNYKPGDRVWMFGFSRGSYTARVLSAMLDAVGLLKPEGVSLLVSAWYIYSGWERNMRNEKHNIPAALLPFQFKEMFSTHFEHVYFMGLFDTVSSVGVITDRIFPKSLLAKNILHARHALSIGERRVKFSDELFACVKNTDVIEKWFLGNHTDIGGGYRSSLDITAEFYISDIPLKWMVAEAFKFEYPFDENCILELALKPNYPSVIAPLHDDLKFFNKDKTRVLPTKIKHFFGCAAWWGLEFLPFIRKEITCTGHHKLKFLPNFGRNRKIPDQTEDTFHWSVGWRIKEKNSRVPLNIKIDLNVPNNTPLPDDLSNVIPNVFV